MIFLPCSQVVVNFKPDKIRSENFDTSSKMVDSWQRYTDIGVKISKIGISLVYCDVPEQFLSHLPGFIQPWIPEPVSIVPAGIHFG